MSDNLKSQIAGVVSKIYLEINSKINETKNYQKIIESLNPDNILKNGYAILTGKPQVDGEIKIETFRQKIVAKVLEIKEK